MAACIHEPRAYKNMKSRDKKYFKPNNSSWMTTLFTAVYEKPPTDGKVVSISNEERKRRRNKTKFTRMASRK